MEGYIIYTKPDVQFVQHIQFITFLNDEQEEIGHLDWENGRFTFHGNVEKSAQGFFNYLQFLVDEYIEAKLLAAHSAS